MKVELTPDAAQWVEAELDAGLFPTAEDAVRYAVNYARVSQLRSELEAAEAEGGSFNSDEVRRFAHEHLDNVARTHGEPPISPVSQKIENIKRIDASIERHKKLLIKLAQ
ncbi:ribbon-helix-helix domain-containing protein [Candidatus Magnetomonas plexicatena]|uniref:ribbon-helix-helix domain-containing protein n=1 Tax=Candidatus Magnetomonas plexicatena TaxID=2552947 RepID=UPI001C742032|nr:hypothetical protein E2O03_014155 [Nitrospirales bacterium LBB_01]